MYLYYLFPIAVWLDPVYVINMAMPKLSPTINQMAASHRPFLRSL